MPPMNILLVDDDHQSRQSLAEFLEPFDFQIHHCPNGEEALKTIKAEHYDTVISDIRMPKMDGLTLQKELNKLNGHQPDIIFMTAYADLNTTIQALRGGAYDFVRKPIDVRELAEILKRLDELQRLKKSHNELKNQFQKKVKEETILAVEQLKQDQQWPQDSSMPSIGIYSEYMKEIANLCKIFHEDRTSVVLINGETGTGKEIVAKMIHNGPTGSDLPYVAVNCSAIPPSLFESELFGYEAGSFTGASPKGQKGKLELADGGTIFLDEIGELPLEFQPKLLRFLQDKEICRIGGKKSIPLNLRIICATNRDLQQMADEKNFRMDLFYRLNIGRVLVKPLKQRQDEIEPLALLFLSQFSIQKNKSFKYLHPDVIKILKKHTWPGNIRELSNAIERIVLLNNGDTVTPAHLAFLNDDQSVDSSQTSFDPKDFSLPEKGMDLIELEKVIIHKTLYKFKQNITHAAEYLNMTRSRLRSKIKSHQIS